MEYKCNSSVSVGWHAPWNPVRELLHSVGRLPNANVVVEWFRNPIGWGGAAKSSPPLPSVVPDTLSGPGLREAGSQVNRYGRAVGRLSGGDKCTGEAVREGTDEISDIMKMEIGLRMARTHIRALHEGVTRAKSEEQR